MSENPYAAGGPSGGGLDPTFQPEPERYAEPERTSLAAILALVCSLTCCLSPVGVLLAIAALVGIGTSRGRVGGRGMAVGALIIGLLLSIALGVVVIGGAGMFGMFGKAFFGPANDVMTAIEAGHYDAARQGLSLPQGVTVTDEQFDAFRDEYQAQFGAFQSVPQGWMEAISAYSSISQRMQNYQQGAPNEAPIPAYFDSGTEILFIEFDDTAAQTGQPGASGLVLPLYQIRVVLPDGSELPLVDPAELNAALGLGGPVIPPGTVDFPSPEIPDFPGPADIRERDRGALPAEGTGWGDATGNYSLVWSSQTDPETGEQTGEATILVDDLLSDAKAKELAERVIAGLDEPLPAGMRLIVRAAEGRGELARGVLGEGGSVVWRE